jgi:hypothetical protein
MVLQPPPAASNSTQPIGRVLAHLEGVHRSGAGWVARCPHHEDKQASLSVREADDGKVLIHCFAGCPNLSVVASAGLSMVDLFPPGSRERRGPRVWKGGVPMGPHGRPALEAFGDPVVASMLAELARLAHVRGRLDAAVAGALRLVAAAVDVNEARLRESVRDALVGDTPA